jgi:hypothetical protein
MIIIILNIEMVDYCNGGILGFDSNGEIIPLEANAKTNMENLSCLKIVFIINDDKMRIFRNVYITFTIF